MAGQRNPDRASVRRSQPRQARALEATKRILSAAAQLLKEKHYGEITMQALADRAAVTSSIIYRYFPNKDALYLRLYDDTVSRSAREMREIQLRYAHAPFELSIRPILATMLKIYTENESVLLQLPEQSPALFQGRSTVTVDKLVETASKIYLSPRDAKQSDDANDRSSYFLLRNAMLENIRWFVLYKPSSISRTVFLEETTKLALGYLWARSTWPTKDLRRAQPRTTIENTPPEPNKRDRDLATGKIDRIQDR